MKWFYLLLLVGLSVCPVVRGEDTAVDTLMKEAPLLKPQADGIVYLNVEAAALVSLTSRPPRLINAEGGVLKVDHGCLGEWNADRELPYWRMELPKAGRYRVVVNHATNTGRESAAKISFRGARRQSTEGSLESTGGWDIFDTSILGEVDLPAGETVVEFRPTNWANPHWVIKLADIRLLPMDDVQRLAPIIRTLLGTLGVTADPEVAALQRQSDELARRLDVENKVSRNRNFSAYKDYREFIAFDEAMAHFTADQDHERTLARQLDALQQQKLKTLATEKKTLPVADQEHLKAYFAAESALLDGAARVYPKVAFLAKNGAAHPASTVNAGPVPLFPTGHFEDLPLQPINTTLPLVTLKLTPPADLVQRQARFAARGSEAGIAELCRDFHAAIKPDSPGLEEFARLYDAGRYGEALDAYRAYFFAKLGQPEKFGMHTQNIEFELTRDRGKGHLLFRPNPKVLDYNLHDCAVTEFNHEVLVGQVGPPGSVCWAPPDMALPPGATYKYSNPTPPEFWKSEVGINLLRENNFFRRITYLPGDTDSYSKGGLFNALLFSYATTGNESHLQRWSDYLDDWAMNAMQDDDNCPFSPKLATELETQELRTIFTLLRIILDERPAFAHDLNPTTLVRLLLKLQDDYSPYTIRAKRAELANWGMMGICHSLNIATFLPEFRASDYVGREAWRLWNINAIQHNTLDGENCEAWDTGHQGVSTEYCNESIPVAKLPSETSALEKTRFWDAMKINMRDLLVHISPAGYFWPPDTAHIDIVHNDLRNRWLKADANGHFALDQIVNEPGAAQRIDTIMNGGKPPATGLLATASDFAPYASMAYLRDSWQPAADYLILQDVAFRSQTLSSCGRGMYLLSAGSRVLARGQSLVVDGKPDNRYYGKIRTGGKTDYCGEAGTHVSADRFYTSAQFDFAEATQDSPYAHPRVPEHDPFGIYRTTPDGLDDPAPITDVIDHRHVFHPRGTGIWIVNDRIENKGTAAHDYTQFVALPARLPDEGFEARVRLLDASQHPLIDEDATRGRARTANPGMENVSTYFVGPSKLTFGNHFVGGTKWEPLKTSVFQTIQADLKAGKTPAQIAKSDGERPCGITWNGAGNQGLVTVLYSRPPVPGLDSPFANDLSKFEEVHGPGNVVGCHLVTPQGTEVWFASGPQSANVLTCGPLSANAEALLVMNQKGKLSGLLLGAKTVRVNGRDAVLGSPDGEFSIDPQGILMETAPIRHAIDTVQILPEADVFTDQAKVSFTIPTQNHSDIEFHYTLDGTDPTLGSPHYEAPFTITDTTLVKVRPFRKGLKVTPWNNNGTDSGLTVSALFRKQASLPPVQVAANLKPGLGYQYFEGPWPRLFTYAGVDGVLKAKADGSVSTLLDPGETGASRRTDRAYAIRYDGYIAIPASAVYTLYAPEPLYSTTMDAGYDLRVFVDGREWFPSPALHARNAWSVALEKGAHTISVAYVDYRWKIFRNDYWMEWHPEEMWQGTPKLEVSAPGLARQSIPAAWFWH